MGCAPVAYILYSKVMKHNPSNSKWFNRDRFILSAGHGSMLLYSVLHLCGYNVSLDDLKNFRQYGSITPGHPEYGHTDGVETTTGPLGQGFANAIGMAIARDYLASLFNKDDIKILDHYIYGICSDGDLMEGISHEAASLAGHLKLGKLIFFYDDNGITIDGRTELAFSDDTKKRFEAYHWQVLNIDDVNDINQILSAVKTAQNEPTKPTLIITKTKIGYGSPNKQDSSSAHGSPLGEEEVKLSKKNLGWLEDKSFFIPEDVKAYFSSINENGIEYEKTWQKKFDEYTSKYPEEARLFLNLMNGEFGDEWEKHLPEFDNYDLQMATRSASEKVLNAIADFLPGLIGGSADLEPSNNTFLKKYKTFSPSDHSGRNFHFGVREHGMGSILNGMAIYGGVIPYGGTFLIFSDYLRPTIRLAALSKVKSIFVFTHDSIGLGEDGPTHQPVEHLSSLRAIPNNLVLRPADANETVEAWKTAIKHKGGPVCLLLTRQKLAVINRKKYSPANEFQKGAYIIKDSESPQLIIMASGSEVELALKSAEKLEEEKIRIRVISFPSWELFELQPDEYKDSILPESVKARVAIEAGVSQGWEKYVGKDGEVISVEKFGASAPVKIIFEKYGFTTENVINTSKSILAKLK
ncbi:MAG: transketolase, partial [Ignavibacteriaceae bacterium]